MQCTYTCISFSYSITCTCTPVHVTTKEHEHVHNYYSASRFLYMYMYAYIYPNTCTGVTSLVIWERGMNVSVDKNSAPDVSLLRWVEPVDDNALGATVEELENGAVLTAAGKAFCSPSCSRSFASSRSLTSSCCSFACNSWSLNCNFVVSCSWIFCFSEVSFD